MIAELVLKLGPVGLDLASKLSSVWSKPELTPAEVEQICSVTQKDYESYIKEAGGRPSA